MRTRPWHVPATAILVVVLAACVGGSGAKTTSTTSTTTAVDADAAELGAKALVVLRDVGAGWVQHAAAKGDSPPRADDCAQRPDGPLSELGPGASQLGASLQLKGQRVYLYSSTLVFPDNAGVEAYLAIRNSSQWHDCRQKQLDADQKQSDPRLSVETTRQTIPGVGSGRLVAYSVFTVLAQTRKGKPPVAVATATRSAYRFGRVIVSLGIDVSSKKNVRPQVDRAVKAGLRRAQQRLGTR
jgi:hypothetical protein